MPLVVQNTTIPDDVIQDTIEEFSQNVKLDSSEIKTDEHGAFDWQVVKQEAEIWGVDEDENRGKGKGNGEQDE